MDVWIPEKVKKSLKLLHLIGQCMQFHYFNGKASKTISPEKYAPMQWHMQARNITINLKVKVYFILPALSATNVVTWKCHVDDSAKGRYNMILGRDILTELGFNLKSS